MHFHLCTWRTQGCVTETVDGFMDYISTNLSPKTGNTRHEFDQNFQLRLTMLCFHSIISEYGRAIVSTYGQEVHNQDTHWLRFYVRASGTSIDGNPNHPLNQGYEGLAWHHTLASIVNHNPYWPNSTLENVDLEGSFSPNLIFPNEAIAGTICVLRATRDCYPHEQVQWNYGSAGAELPFLFA